MESPIQTLDENNASKSEKNVGPKKGVRQGKGQGSVLRPRAEKQANEEKEEGNVTLNGKEILVVQASGSPHVRIKFAFGGELPSDLQGLFTSPYYAQLAINSYLDRKRK